MTDDLKPFEVHLDNGRIYNVLAEDGDKAIDAYYESLESIAGHIIGICGCHGPKKSIDRSIPPKPLKIVDHKTKQVVRTLLYPGKKDWGW